MANPSSQKPTREVDAFLTHEADPRPCKGDAFVRVGPWLRREGCYNCARHKSRGGKCLGDFPGREVLKGAGIG